MPTRDQIVEAADRLFYRSGYDHTSFADIAAAVRISRGNFYHHFKSKDDILDAVIARRLEATRAMLGRWEAEGKHPEERIESFIRILLVNRKKIRLHGCPVGTLCTELAKLRHDALGTASQLFSLFRVWLRRQFSLLGRERDADALALHLLGRSQGVATLFNALEDDAFLEREVELMCDWLRSCASEGSTGGPPRKKSCPPGAAAT